MDWLVGFVTLVAMELIARRHWYGWVVALAGQALWLALIYQRRLWGLAPLALLLVWRYAAAFCRWRRDQQRARREQIHALVARGQYPPVPAPPPPPPSSRDPGETSRSAPPPAAVSTTAVVGSIACIVMPGAADTTVLAHVERAARQANVAELVVITGPPLGYLPTAVAGKPLHVVHLSGRA